MASAAVKAAAAMTASNYTEAIELYSTALHSSPTAVDYYIQRSTAYQRSNQPDRALQDAEVALALANRRAKRELILNAQFRRAIALAGLKRWEDAAFLFGIVKAKDEKFKGLLMWNSKCEAELKKMELSGVSVKETVDVDLKAVEKGGYVGSSGLKERPKVEELDDDDDLQEALREKEKIKLDEKQKAVEVKKPVSNQLSITSPQDKIKEDWYQTPNSVTLSLLVKNVPKETTTVEITNTTVSISTSQDVVMSIR
jgi:suppressor of G2 allele of SKP1